MPNWLRHIISWKMLDWIDRHTNVCWAKVVMWKMYGDEKSLAADAVCFGSDPPYDYCGKFCTKAWTEEGRFQRKEAPNDPS